MILRALILAAALLLGQASYGQDPRPAETLPLAAESLLLDAAVAEDWGVVVGERGHILVSDDFERWTQADVPASATLTGVALAGDSVWAVGHDAVIMMSPDRGRTWTLQNWAPDDQEPLLDVLFVDAQTGFAIGAYGLLMVTRDGGSSWTREAISDEDDFHLNAIARFGETGLFVAAEAGSGYRSDDLGSTWEAVSFPYQGSMFAVMAVTDNELIALGLRGHIQYSKDGGVEWSELTSPTNRSLLGGGLVEGKVMLVGADGAIVTGSADSGFAQFVHPDGETLAAIRAVGDGRVVLVGQGGVRLWKP